MIPHTRPPCSSGDQEHSTAPVPMKLKNFLKEALAKGLISEIFAHCRNISIASVFVAAGGYISKNPPQFAPPIGFLNSELAGNVVVALGIALLFLNLMDGIQKLSRLKGRLLFDVLLLLVYGFVLLRLVQILTLFRFRS